MPTIAPTSPVPPPTTGLATHRAATMSRALAAPAWRVPGPELPGIPPSHPALPLPVPTLEQLARIAESAPASHRFTPGSHPSTITNAHYSNTRAQLGYALAGPYNSVEGDVRIKDGIPVMVHDAGGASDLTFEQWALLAHRAGKHLRIDLKEARALPQVASLLERIGVPSGSITFNVGIITPWSHATQSPDAIRALRARFPESWITLNLPVPLGPGFVLAERFARTLHDPRLGVAILAGLTTAADVRLLRRSFAVVNAWNLPQLGSTDPATWTARLRAMGVNGMIDLRRRDDPLAGD
ncbi:MAG: hypothetical protein JWM86_2358 [Thermoleophilia bacterium]|nr:hypothetical protein [Thermoleophilia bacterium]